MKSGGVFVDLLGTERIRIKNYAPPGAYAGMETTLDQAFQIAPAFVLAANETRQFEGTFEIPPNVQPTFTGVHASHHWEIRGRIEAFGNDPDSGYQPLRVGMKA